MSVVSGERLRQITDICNNRKKKLEGHVITEEISEARIFVTHKIRK
jgi:hypothetical protein